MLRPTLHSWNTLLSPKPVSSLLAPMLTPPSRTYPHSHQRSGIETCHHNRLSSPQLSCPLSAHYQGMPQCAPAERLLVCSQLHLRSGSSTAQGSRSAHRPEQIPGLPQRKLHPFQPSSLRLHQALRQRVPSRRATASARSSQPRNTRLLPGQGCRCKQLSQSCGTWTMHRGQLQTLSQGQLPCKLRQLP